MSTYEDHAADARDNARDATRCLGCALGLPHDSDQCEAEDNRE